MRFPIPKTGYDEHGIAAGLCAAISKAGSELYQILEDQNLSDRDTCKLANSVASELGETNLVKMRFIVDAAPRESTFTMSHSAVAALLDAGAFHADLVGALRELKSDPGSARDVLRDFAFSLSTHDHARSVAEWLKVSPKKELVIING